jgi:hypothetical protein
MNLLGYCKEEHPFTRVMVFEYAPNGTLFEHLHSKCIIIIQMGHFLNMPQGLGCTPACRLALLSVLGRFLPFTGWIVNLIAMYPWGSPPFISS